MWCPHCEYYFGSRYEYSFHKECGPYVACPVIQMFFDMSGERLDFALEEASDGFIWVKTETGIDEVTKYTEER